MLVVEDVHWADEATLDVLRYVGRRIADLPAMLLLTYRDDEIANDHLLLRLLGALSGEAVRRVRLAPLSRSAVASWAGRTGATASAVYRSTGGNPFRLLARGLTNAEIAAKLVLSVRTIDHHVSAVLQKLQATSRREAAQAAARLGITA